MRSPRTHRTLRSWHRVRTGTLFIGLMTVVIAGASGSAEIQVEDFSGSHHFAPRWPGGTFELGDDSGFSWAHIVTDGDGESAFVANVRPYKPLVDATGKFVKVRVKVDELSKLAGLEFRLSSDRFATNFFAFTFPIYADTDFNILRDGVWTTLTFSFGEARIEGKPDRSQINSVGWYVADKGNDAPVSVFWGGLSLVDEPPEGVVTITFDDGYDENILAAEIMARYGMAGTAYVIPRAIGQVGYLAEHQLADLQLRYGWDVAAHDEASFTELRPNELESEILSVQQFLVENGYGNGAAHLAYPLGRQNTALVRPLVRKYFATARVAAHGPETLPPADPHLLRVLNVTNEMTPKEVTTSVKRARDNHEWLILMFHYLVEKPEISLEYGITDFERLIAEIAKTEIKVLPLTKVWEACGRDFAGPSPNPSCDFETRNVAAPTP